MNQSLQTSQHGTVYNNLKQKYDKLSRPTGLLQVHQKCCKNKEENACNCNNIADQILVEENMVSQNHPFVRRVIRDTNKTPCIILKTDEQIEDLKSICCNGDAVFGVDTTFYILVSTLEKAKTEFLHCTGYLGSVGGGGGGLLSKIYCYFEFLYD